MLQKITNSFALAFANIRSNFFHTFLSVLGIVIGVAALVSILSLIDGMEKFARDQISNTTSLNGIIIQSEAYKSVNDVRLRKDTLSVIDYDQFVALTDALSKPVKSYIRSSSSKEVLVSSTGTKIGVNVVATASSLQPGVENPDPTLFTESDIVARKPQVVVNHAFVKASEVISDDEMIGKEIIFNEMNFIIQGVLVTKQESPQLFYPITMLSESELQAAPPEVLFESTKTEDIPVLKEEMSGWLKAHFKNATSDFKIITNDYRIEQATRGFLLFRVIMGLIVGISVLVGGIGVMNVLLISVRSARQKLESEKRWEPTGAILYYYFFLSL